MAHSWNAPHLFSSALMLNATRHSDHHVHPTRGYASLSLPPAAPMLPWPLPLAALIALYPPLWRRKMRPLVKQWSLPQP
jgi:alkane 1-monooxygenase